VLATKLGALLGGMTALTVALMAVWTAAFVGIAHLRGTMAGMTSGAWQSIGIMEARGLVLVLVVTAIGFGLASIGRHTAMAMGVAIGLVVVFQFGLGTVLSLANVKFPEAYLLPYWAIAWMKQKFEIQDFNSCNFSAVNGCQPDTLTITWQMAGIALTVGFVAIVGAALWTIRRRDIT
jgi:ABC-type transport system involved in multi-copper enzyme maturation permease subunit